MFVFDKDGNGNINIPELGQVITHGKSRLALYILFPYIVPDLMLISASEILQARN